MRVKRRKVGDPLYPHLSSIIRRDLGCKREQWWRKWGSSHLTATPLHNPLMAIESKDCSAYLCQVKISIRLKYSDHFYFSTCLPMLRLSTLLFPKGCIWNLLPKPTGSLFFIEGVMVCEAVATRGRSCGQIQDRNWRSPRCPTLYTRHSLTTHQNKILSLEESFLVKDFCSPGSLWSGIFFTAVQVQYSNIPSFFWPWYTPCFLVSSTTSSTAKTAALQLFASYNLLYKRAAPWHSIRWVCLGKNVRTGQGTHPTQTGHVLKFVFCVCVFLCFYFSLLFFFLIFKWRRITKY